MGIQDPKVSAFCKCWIKQGSTVVVGVIGEGTTKEVQANWESPFEMDSVGSKYEKAGGLLQAESGMTSVTTMNSQ